jgi:hypothetical protein
MKIVAKLTLTVVYDDGGDENFYAGDFLNRFARWAINDNLLTPDTGSVTIDTTNVEVSTKELP